MGVDLATYRTRIGTFRHSEGVDVVTVVCYVNFVGGLKTAGSVIFIGILLLIAGIESNPGPKTEGDETQILQYKLKVTDLPDDVDEEMLKTFFEQNDDLDGGKVTSVTLDRNANLAVIEFEDSEAVETVLRKQPIIIHEKQVAVESLEDHDGRPTTIMVSELPDNVDEDILEMFFENTKKQGGGPVKKVMIDKKKNAAFVEFKDPRAVENVLAKQPVTILGKRVHVAINLQGEEIVEELTTIKVSGLPDHANEESLEMFFENTKKQGGGPVKKITVNKQRKLAFVEFEEPGAVETVLAKRPITFLGTRVEIEKQDTKTLEQPTTIKVSGFPDHADEDTLEMFFANTKKQGGGPVRKVTIDRQKKVAFIEFEEPGAVEIVLAKQPITFFGTQAKIELPGEETVEQPTTIKVSGIPKHVDEESLEMFFENTKKQGGGPVRKVTIDKQKQVAFIEFEEPEAVETVLTKQPIVLFGSQVKVEIKGEETVKQPTTIKVTGIPEHADEESLEMFFENTKKQGGGPVKMVTIDRQKNVAFIEFEESGAVETVLKKQPISIFGQRVGIELMDEETVEKPTTIKVSGLPEHADEDSLEMFFENTKKCGGGPIRKVTVDKQKQVAFIEFEDSGAVENVLAHQPITLFGTQVKVEILGVETVKQSSTIKVSGLPEHADEESLELLFENTKKQGGGPVRKVTFDKQKKVAHVEFEEPEAVQTVLAKRPITIFGTQVMVDVFDLETVEQPTTIKVSNIPEHVDEESLEMFFENTKKHGGGPVRKVTLDKQKKVAFVEFQEPEAVSIVLKKRPIQMFGKQVTVDILDVARVDESTKVQAIGLPKDVNTRMLIDVFEDTEQGGGPVKDVIIYERNDAALVEFQNPEAATAILNKGYVTVSGKKVMISEFKDPVHVTNDTPEFTARSESPTPKDNVDGVLAFKEDDFHEGISKWMHNLELNRYMERKLTVEDTLAIDLSACQKDVCHKLRELPVLFLKQLLAANSECMDLRTYNLEPQREYSESREMDSVEAILYTSNDEEMISPLDLLLIAFQSCDLELRQLLCHKLYLCKLAVPFLFHDIYLGKDLLSIWPLHSVIIENKFSVENTGSAFTETEVLKMPTKTVAFARFGRPNCSKSKFLNGVICSVSDSFFHKECQSGLTTRYCTEGYVEMFWLPTIGETASRFKDPITFFNLRGNILNSFFEKHKTLILSLSDVFILFLDIKSVLDFESQIKSVLMKHKNIILVISSPIDSNDKKTVKALKNFELSVKSNCQSLHLLCTYSGHREKTQIDVCMEISDKIRKVLASVNPISGTLYYRVKACTQYQALTDENDMCISAMETAKTVLEMMKTTSEQEHWTSKVTPVQYVHSRKLGKLLKDIRSKKEVNENQDVRNEIDETRRLQLCVTKPVKLFICHLIEFSSTPNKLHFFLTWLNIYLEEEKRKTSLEMVRKHQGLWTKYNDLKREEKPNAQEIKKYEERIQKSEIEIEEASFGIANFFREIAHVYDAIIHLNRDPRQNDLPDLDVISKVFARFILSGHTFELLDGNSLLIPIMWNKAVLGYVHKQIACKKVLAFSVLGLQSSGKSTLLNTMFGVQFTASSGRCTRGIHAQLIPVKQPNEQIANGFDYVLVIDTEGLRAPELKDTNYRRDNELATIITGLGDITMLNVMGENTAEIRDVLQIIVHAFLRLNLANSKVEIRKKCVFIHQNVSDVSADEKMKAGLQVSVETLDKVTKESAESEGIANINTFDQVITFNPDTDVWYLPNLWKGNPPMAQVNRKYSEKVVDISHKIVRRSLNDRSKSFKSLEDIIDYTHDLWQGVLAENFLFSFRNSVEKKAYIALESKLKGEFWRIETSVDEKLFKLCKEKFSKCETKAVLEEEKESIGVEIHKFVAEKEAAMSQCLEEFFEKNEYKDTTIQWKEQTLNQVKMFTTGIFHKKKPEIESLYQRRAGDIFAQSINAKNEDELRKKSAEVAQRLRGQNLSDQQIDEEFEKIWTSFVKDSLASVNTTESQSTTLHKFFVQRLDTAFAYNGAVLYQVLNQHSMLEKRLDVKCLLGSFDLTNITAEDLSLKSTIHKLAAKLNISDKTQKALETARNNLEEVFRIADERIEKDKQKDEELTDSDIGSFLHDINQTICKTFEQDSYPFTIKVTFYIKAMVHISNIACTHFEEHNLAYQLKYGIKAKLQKYKCQCRDRLYAHLKDRKKEETAAILFRHAAVTYIVETVLDSMSMNSKSRLRPSLPSNKYGLIVDILTDLSHKNDFYDFLQYIRHPQSFAESWVTNKTTDILFGSSPSLYSEIAESDMRLYINDLKKAIGKSDLAFNETPSIDEWITYLCTELQYCKFPPESFNEVRQEFGQACHVNVENFKSSLLEQMMQAEKDMKLEFFAVTAETVKWRAFNPCDDIFSELWGCGEECTFCGEPCKNGTKDHVVDHECLQHRPGGLIGIRKSTTQEVTIATCDFSIASGSTATCGVFSYKCNKDSTQSCSLQSHPYSDYKKFFPTWDIKPGSDMVERSKFWFWFMAKYKQKLKDRYSYDIWNIPKEWSSISVDDALRSLRQLYL